MQSNEPAGLLIRRGGFESRTAHSERPENTGILGGVEGRSLELVPNWVI